MILPGKIQINKAKAQETKNQIDEGLALARKVDAMRELKIEQEIHIKQWRDVTVRETQLEINRFIERRDVARQEALEAEKVRNELRKPLDYEWIKLNEEKEKAIEDKNTLFLDKQSFKIEVQSFEDEKAKLNTALEKATENEKDTEKNRLEAENLKEVAEQQSNLARTERENGNKIIERKVAELQHQEKIYEVALKTIELRENQVKEKEEELITRENDLARRLKNLQRVEDK